MKGKITIMISAFIVLATHVYLMFFEGTEQMYMIHNWLMVVLGALIIGLSIKK